MDNYLVIRPAEPDDFEAVQRLQLAGGQTIMINGNATEIADMKLQSSNPNGIFGIAELNDEIVGFIYGEKLADRWAMVSYFSVRADVRGSQVYYKLGKWFESRAKALGTKYILIYVDTKNDRLMNFYKYFGFDAGGTYTEMIKKV